MHCLTASGDIAQYLVNQMVLRFCVALGMEVTDWDDFHMKLEGIPRLRKDFFVTRIVNDSRAHMRGFAADCLSAMTVIGLFILLVVLPKGFTAMNAEIQCFSHMFIILQILRRGNPADLPRLKQEIRLHHFSYITVFPQCLKPKLHYLIHISECWEAWGCLLNCYGAEADHRDVCRIFRFCTKKPSDASISHALHGLIAAVQKWTTFAAVFLIEPVQKCNPANEYEQGGERCIITHHSKQMQAEFGIIRTGDCVTWKNGDVRKCGKALLFAQFHRPTQDNLVHFGCVVQCHESHPDGWWHDQGTKILVPIPAIDFTVDFAQEESRIMPLIPPNF